MTIREAKRIVERHGYSVEEINLNKEYQERARRGEVDHLGHPYSDWVDMEDMDRPYEEDPLEDMSDDEDLELFI
jgi:hypothetical protein